MEVKEFQKLCTDIVEELDNKYNIERNPQLNFTQLMEEVGELAKEINKPKLRNQEIDQENLRGEFADVLLQLTILAKIHNVDLEDAVKNKIIELKKRHDINI
jgi:NTP pyrophosphatase (non-canonical NTP hydrolase)